jgi:hydrogenase maturation protease
VLGERRTDLNGGPDTVVIGLGNVVLSDDGLGVHTVRRLRDRCWLADRVELIEGGTAGLLLLPHLADARRVIIVNAIDTGAPAGTLVRLPGEDWASAFAIRITPHDVGLRDLLGAARLSGAWPRQLVLHGVQPASTAIGTELSAPVEAALDPLVCAIVAELTAWDVSAVHGAPACVTAGVEASACA